MSTIGARVALALITALWLTDPSARLLVSVRVDAVDNLRSGQIFSCIDPQPFGCGRGDFYAVMSFMDGDGTVFQCAKTGFIEDRDFPRPGWECLNIGGAPITATLTGDARFRIAIWDFDGGWRAIDGDDPVDVGGGLGSAYEVQIHPGVETIVSPGPDVSVTFTLTATVEPNNVYLTLSANNFIPSLGQSLIVNGETDEGECDVFVAIMPSGSNIPIRRLTPTLGSDLKFRADWDGRDESGAVVAPGTYTIQADTVGPLAASGQSATRDVMVITPPVETIAIILVSPKQWAPQTGELEATYTVSQSTQVQFELFDGSGCVGMPVRSYAGKMATAGTRSELLDGHQTPAAFFTPGPISIRATASFATPKSDCRNLTIVAASPLRLWVESDPPVAAGSEIVKIRARPLDDQSEDRRTALLEVWVATAAQIASGMEPVTPTKICPRAPLCELEVQTTLPSPSTNRESLAFRARGLDADGSAVDTGWRVMEVVRGAALSSNAISSPYMASVPMGPFGTVVARNFTVDVVFHPGTGYTGDVATDRPRFMNKVSEHIRTYFGAASVSHTVVGNLIGNRNPSALLEGSREMAYFVSSNPVRVVRGSVGPFAQGLCFATYTSPPAFAEANVAIHTVNCRDNAPLALGNKFYTAAHPLVGFHELHHAAFGLSDEYCCDTALFEPPWDPNLYANPPAGPFGFALNRCNADPLAISPCTANFDSATGMPGALATYRLDPDPDVMRDFHSTKQNPAEVRRINSIFANCRAGRC